MRGLRGGVSCPPMKSPGAARSEAVIAGRVHEPSVCPLTAPATPTITDVTSGRMPSSNEIAPRTLSFDLSFGRPDSSSRREPVDFS
ncbi:unnamed protein product [Larinioides sclopetarius]|uniref:Uncharacterized protein n=1 Tax=Larinioides sclopetarius TaxID=280406 RepID=A0AAV1Z1Z2_9ARAC